MMPLFGLKPMVLGNAAGLGDICIVFMFGCALDNTVGGAGLIFPSFALHQATRLGIETWGQLRLRRLVAVSPQIVHIDHVVSLNSCAHVDVPVPLPRKTVVLYLFRCFAVNRVDATDALPRSEPC